MRPVIIPVVLAIVAPSPVIGWSATPARPGAHTPGDPWESSNRRIFAFNQRLDRALLAPLSRLTNGLTPGVVGRAIHNFLQNLKEPVVIVNDLLQARPGPGFRSAFRLVVNTTVGGLGVVDVAKVLGFPWHVNGFGDTLGRWGVGPGPYLVVPVLGPATVRDLFGSIADDATLPLQFVNYPYRFEIQASLTVVGGLNERAEFGKELDALLGGAADPYATLRSSYLQSREAQIRGQEALPPLPDIEDVAPAPDVSDAGSPASASGAPVDAQPPATAAPEPTPPSPAPSDPKSPPQAATGDLAPSQAAADALERSLFAWNPADKDNVL